MNIIKKTYSLFIMLYALFIISACTDNRAAIPRSIAVIGSATVYAKPNEVLISFELHTRDKQLLVAKQKNRALLQKLQTAIKEFSIDQKDIFFNHNIIRPEHRYHPHTGERLFTGYHIQQSISIKLKDLTQYESFVTALLSAGIDNINDMRFLSNELQNHRNTARRQAVQAAIQKAGMLCAEATQAQKPANLGKILEIREIGIQRYPHYERNARYAKQSNHTMYALTDEAASLQDSFTPFGYIPIEVELEVVFALE